MNRAIQLAAVSAQISDILNRTGEDNPIAIPRAQLQEWSSAASSEVGAMLAALSPKERAEMNQFITLAVSAKMPSLPVHTIPEVSPPTSSCPFPGRYSCYDGVSTEVEVLELLYALVRVHKPDLVVETGTYLGYGAYYLASALKVNYSTPSMLYTAEVNAEIAAMALLFIDGKGLTPWVKCFQCTGLFMLRDLGLKNIDMAFIDSGSAQERVEEIKYLFDTPGKLSPRGIIVVHDTASGWPGYETIGDYIHWLHAQGKVIFYRFPTPRGVDIIYKADI